MKINLRIVDELYLILIVLYSFVFAGFLQFFFGISNTIISFIATSTFLLWFLIKTKCKINKGYLSYLAISLIILVYIFIVSFINDKGFVRPVLYSQFFLVPISIFLLIYGNGDRTLKYLNLKKVKKLLLYLAILQLPILVIQRIFVDSLIKYNNSGKLLDAVDFYFGSFPLKNDHSLGFFLVVNLLYIWSYKVLKNKFQLVLVSIVLIINLLLTNSNTSVLFAIGATGYLIIRDKKYRLNLSIKKISIVILLSLILFYILEYFEPIFYYDVKYKLFGKLDLDDAIYWYKQGQARREQIILVLISEGINYFGNGAYAYFDIITGQFNKTFRHFSQLIWTYYDLGIIGLVFFLNYVISIHKVLKEKNANYNIYLTFGLLLYSFFTVMTFDLSFMLTYFIYKRKDD